LGLKFEILISNSKRGNGMFYISASIEGRC